VRENTYKFLKFLNCNKVIVGVFVFVLFFVSTKSVYAGAGEAVLNVLNVSIGTILRIIAQFIIAFSAWGFGLIFPIFLNITGTLLNSTPINTAWILVRDLVNMFFIFFLLFTSLAKLVGKENILAQKSASKQIIYILLAAFLINFSKVICGVVIDIAQIVTLQFTNSFVEGLRNLDNVFKAPDGIEPSVLTGILFMIFALAFLATAMTAILYILIRAISLGIYAALSPLWFLWLSFPTKSKTIDQIKGETMDKFFQAAIGGPILAFYLWIALMLIVPGQDGNITDKVGGGGAGAKTIDLTSTVKTGDATTDNAVAGFDAAIVMKMIVASAVMLFAQKQAMEMAKKAGTIMGKGLMDGVVNKVGAIGMKPLDGLKNKAMNGAKTVGNFAQSKIGKVGDTMMGSAKTSFGNMVESNKTLKGMSRFKNNLVAGSIENSKYLSGKKSQSDAYEKAMKSGDLEAIKNAKEAIDKRQIEQGKKVAEDMKTKGAGEFFLGGAWRAGAAAVSTGKAIISGEELKSSADLEKDRLQKRREYMVDHPEKFAKEDIATIDAGIGKQSAFIEENKNRKELADKRSRLGVAKSGTNELEYLKKKQENSDMKSFADSGIKTEDDFNKKRNEAEIEENRLRGLFGKSNDPEVEERLKVAMEKAKAEKENLDKKKKAFDKNGGFNSNMGQYIADSNRVEELERNKKSYVTADEIRKQDGAYAGSVKKVDGSDKKIAEARDKAAGIIEKKDDSTSLKAFKEKMEKMSDNFIDSNGKVKNDADMHLVDNVYETLLKGGKKGLTSRGGEADLIAATAFKIKNKTLSDNDLSILKNPMIQKELKEYLRRQDDDFKTNWNNIIKEHQEEVVKSLHVQTFDKTDKAQMDKNRAEKLAANNGVDVDYEDEENKNTSINSSVSFLSKMNNVSQKNPGNYKEEIFEAFKQNDSLPKEFIAEVAKLRQEWAAEDKKKGIITGDDYSGKQYGQQTAEAIKQLSESFVHGAPGVELSHGSVRLLAGAIADNVSKAGSNPSDMQNSVASTIDSNNKLAKSFQGFADNFSVLSGDFVSLAHELSSGIKDETQRTTALATVMEKLISKEDNLTDANKALEEAIRLKSSSIVGNEDVYRKAFASAKDNIENKNNKF